MRHRRTVHHRRDRELPLTQHRRPAKRRQLHTQHTTHLDKLFRLPPHRASSVPVAPRVTQPGDTNLQWRSSIRPAGSGCSVQHPDPGRKLPYLSDVGGLDPFDECGDHATHVLPVPEILRADGNCGLHQPATPRTTRDHEATPGPATDHQCGLTQLPHPAAGCNTPRKALASRRAATAPASPPLAWRRPTLPQTYHRNEWRHDVDQETARPGSEVR
jgi:hypothetical protein